jgi:hypothetical protein
MSNGFKEFIRDCEDVIEVSKRAMAVPRRFVNKWARADVRQREELREEWPELKKQAQELDRKAHKIIAGRSYLWATECPVMLEMTRSMAKVFGANVETIKNGKLWIIVRVPSAQEAT